MEKIAKYKKTISKKKLVLESLLLFSPLFIALIVVGVSFPGWYSLAFPYKMALYVFFVPIITSVANFIAYIVAVKKQTNLLRKVFLSIFLSLSIGNIIFQLFHIFSFSWLWMEHAIAYTTLINALIGIVLNAVLIGYFKRKRIFLITEENLEDLTQATQGTQHRGTE